MPTEKINDHTAAEIAEAFARISSRAEPKEKACLWCGKVQLMRLDQKFCCPAHKATYAREAARMHYEKLCVEREQWQLERAELLHEINALRKEVARISVWVPPGM